MAYVLTSDLLFVLAAKSNPDHKRFTIMPIGRHSTHINICEKGHVIGTWDGSTSFIESFKNSDPNIQHLFAESKYRSWLKLNETKDNTQELIERENIIRFLEKAK
jgi:hypothetical protein